jgi:hypothetical protein
MLREFVITNRQQIIERCQAKVASRSAPLPGRDELDHGVPMFLDQLIVELQPESSGLGEIAKTATKHGRELLAQGFTVAQVVHDYGDVCQAITEMVMERGIQISADDFRVLNRSLDDAIAGAVTEYGRGRDESIAGGARENERVAVLARALRVSVYTASVAFAVIKSGKVGIAGSTGTLVEGHLSTAQDLIDRLLDDRPIDKERQTTGDGSGDDMRSTAVSTPGVSNE